MIWGFALILLSIFAIPSLLLCEKPNANELLEHIEPHQGWIGLLFCVWGVWGVTSSVLNIDLFSTFPLWWITLLIGNIIEVVLGFLLAFGLINKYFSTEMESEKRALLRKKRAPKLGRLGIVGLFVGVWMTAASYLFL
ncbi:hypothetical protein Q4566_16595 [Tamlana sp. 2_MG-2023]|uniref:hypothetical protein n=1 Tax=unclassified Tamlana TaxID=2614803 RepID=UPI0026E3A60E|nr:MULTISPECIES: hypothetical protein [unclassified Tamlana]MDO6761827.1 hypothetical protein [Tamlana sp. 2_MG-2023]MDO6792600.1 hypothetical protein [Tamlana sp. 1_MG-2023]